MFNLYTDSTQYVKNAKAELSRYLSRYKKTFYILSVIIALGVASTAIITTIMVSKVWYQQYPNWFFFFTAGISAFSALLTSIINYFLIRDKIQSYKRKLLWIEAEEEKYRLKLTRKYQSHYRDYHFYTSVASYLDNMSAKREAQHD